MLWRSSGGSDPRDELIRVARAKRQNAIVAGSTSPSSACHTMAPDAASRAMRVAVVLVRVA